MNLYLINQRKHYYRLLAQAEQLQASIDKQIEELKTSQQVLAAVKSQMIELDGLITEFKLKHYEPAKPQME